jgi:hypothetical protein
MEWRRKHVIDMNLREGLGAARTKGSRSGRGKRKRETRGSPEQDGYRALGRPRDMSEREEDGSREDDVKKPSVCCRCPVVPCTPVESPAPNLNTQICKMQTDNLHVKRLCLSIPPSLSSKLTSTRTLHRAPSPISLHILKLT